MYQIVFFCNTEDVIELENDEYPFLQPEHSRYYRDCILAANEFLTRPENAEFMKWVRHHGKVHVALKGTTDYTYSGLLYQMFEYEPFRSILGTDMTAGVVDVRPARNLALLSQVIGKYEYLHRIDVLNGKTINSNTEKFFNLYLRLLYDGGINEYEDDAEYAPSGCVSFLTIHQSKGMEFPIVVVDSLSSVPRKNSRDLILEIEEKYFQRPAYEPYSETKYFDFWRLYYTAFSRAQDLLVLTCNENKRTPSQYFREPQREAALNQVLRYVERQHGDWSLIQQAEVDVSLVKPDYIIEGKIDLVKGENGTVEIVDFKSEKKPDLVKQADRLEQYRRQLHLYAQIRIFDNESEIVTDTLFKQMNHSIYDCIYQLFSLILASRDS